MKSYFLNQSILISTLKITIVLSIFTFSSCNKEEIENNEIVINDNYYVNYIIKGNGPYGHFSDWIATTPEGTYINSGYQIRTWSQTYGPVNKGFKCEVQVRDYISGAPTIEIYVSKNQEPFALKTTKIGKSASYTIDF